MTLNCIVHPNSLLECSYWSTQAPKAFFELSFFAIFRSGRHSAQSKLVVAEMFALLISAHDYAKPHGWPESAHPKPVWVSQKPVYENSYDLKDYEFFLDCFGDVCFPVVWDKVEVKQGKPLPRWCEDKSVCVESYLTH